MHPKKASGRERDTLAALTYQFEALSAQVTALAKEVSILKGKRTPTELVLSSSHTGIPERRWRHGVNCCSLDQAAGYTKLKTLPPLVLCDALRASSQGCDERLLKPRLARQPYPLPVMLLS